MIIKTIVVDWEFRVENPIHKNIEDLMSLIFDYFLGAPFIMINLQAWKEPFIYYA